jgi:predicted NBD/HSP70 family sugar kinase
LKAAVAGCRACGDEMGGGVLHRIGLSVPGLIDPAAGTVMMTPSLPKFKGYPLANEIARHIGVPVLADNDANVTVLAELWFGERDDVREVNLVLLSISECGVGSGVVVNSNLYRGHNGTWAGEFGHMVIDRTGPKCNCGRRGCWELFISDQATWRRYDQDRRFTPALFQDLIRLALEGDTRAVNAFEETATFLSLGLSNIIFAINPSSIILGGEITKVWKLIRRTVEGAWRSPGLDSQIRVSPHSLYSLQTQGTIVLALQDIFAEPEFGLHKTASGAESKPARIQRAGAGRHAARGKSG